LPLAIGTAGLPGRFRGLIVIRSTPGSDGPPPDTHARVVGLLALMLRLMQHDLEFE
jgi:hypothetical protein